jgi:quercetin dioxygenase-like cupin family protein
MHVTRLSDAREYEVANHVGVSTLRLQGFDVSPAHAFWVGLSYLLPGGGAEMEASPLEKIYVVLAGRVTVTTTDGSVSLNALDSCWLAPNEARSVRNEDNAPASMLVLMPYPSRVQDSSAFATHGYPVGGPAPLGIRKRGI